MVDATPERLSLILLGMSGGMINRAVVRFLATTAVMASSAPAVAWDYRSDHSGYTCHQKPPAVSIQVVAAELKVELDTSLDADQIGALAAGGAGGGLKH